MVYICTMRARFLFISTLVFLLVGATSAQAQEVKKEKFNPNYSIQDVSAELGVLSSVDDGRMDTIFLQMTYSRLFWRHFAFRTGIMAAPEPGGFEYLAGIPLGISYKTGTVSFEDAASYALTGAISDAVWDGLFGHSDQIGGDILVNLLFMLFRRWEFYIGVTPGYYLGAPSKNEGVETYDRFSLWGDAGAILSIPIWRLSLNLSPTFHYSFMDNYTINGVPTRSIVSFSAGISWLF